MANKVKFGLKNVHYAVRKGFDSTTHKAKFDTPVPIPGAVNISLEAQGEESPFYADNYKYFSVFSNNGYSGDFEMARIPDSFRKDVLGETEEGNLLVESGDPSTTEFALGFQIDGDDEETMFWYLSNTVSRPTLEGATEEDKIEPKTDKLSITSTRAVVNDQTQETRTRVMTKEGASSTFKESFFDSVVFEDDSNHTVTYNNNGGTGTIASQQKIHGTALTLSDGTGFTKSGSTLSKWNTQADGQGTDYALGASYTAEADVTLYAVWGSANRSVKK